MENNQTTQQSSEVSDSKPSQSSAPPGRSGGSNFLLKLLSHSSWLLVWGGVSAFLLAITAIAIFSLTHTGSVVEQKPQPTPVAADNPAETPSQPGNPMPLWLLGAVALSCAAGSLVIYKRLNNPSQPRQLRKRVKRSSAQALTRRKQRQKRLQESLPVPTPIESSPPVAPVPVETEPVVTVVPPEETHPLDSSEESLAERMDIRKHQPLSSILRDP